LPRRRERSARLARRILIPLWLARDVMLLWLARSRQRSALAQLDARLLRDIGLAKPEAEREAQKRFWQ
jgi:uncharacterized protein YjiS (DUF1127 family)